jgi:hypothetical protein
LPIPSSYLNTENYIRINHLGIKCLGECFLGTELPRCKKYGQLGKVLRSAKNSHGDEQQGTTQLNVPKEKTLPNKSPADGII